MKTAKLLFFSLLLILTGCEKSDNLNTTIETLEVLNITAYSAELNGNLESEENLQILSKGFLLAFEPEPVFGDNSITFEGVTGRFKYEATSLRAGKTYYTRAFYTTETDTAYGDLVEFKTRDYLIFNPHLEYGTVADIDGNVYKTIQIGEQTWMAENLRTTRYQNGDLIEYAENFDQWFEFYPARIKGAYIYYKNDIEYKNIHGALYNWNTAIDTRNVAPAGWRVPSIDDWQKLIDYLDPHNTGTYGDNLRETTTAHWYYVNPWAPEATNSTGFTAIASGFAHIYGTAHMGYNCRYWTNTITPRGPTYVDLYSQKLHFHEDIGPAGYIIRCIKE